jgi:hypothetical protein
LQLAKSERLRRGTGIALTFLPLAAGVAILALFLFRLIPNDIETIGDPFFYISFLLFAGFTATAALVDFDHGGKKLVYVGYSVLSICIIYQTFFLMGLFWEGILLPQEVLDKNNCSERSPSSIDTEYCAELLADKGMKIQSHWGLLGIGLAGWVASILFFILRVEYGVL